MFVIRPLPSSSIRGVQQSGRRPAAGSPDRRVGAAGPLRADADSSKGGPQLRCRQVGCRDRQGTRPFREHCGVLRPRGRPEARRASAGRARVAIGVAPRVHSPSFCVSGRESPTASFRARRSEPRIPFSRVALTPAAEAGLTALDDIARSRVASPAAAAKAGKHGGDVRVAVEPVPELGASGGADPLAAGAARSAYRPRRRRSRPRGPDEDAAGLGHAARHRAPARGRRPRNRSTTGSRPYPGRLYQATRQSTKGEEEQEDSTGNNMKNGTGTRDGTSKPGAGPPRPGST